jgi:4-amino-4-deoxy-L-arabinose transferase-like glycosyltransferase
MTALLFAAGLAFGLAILTRPVLMYFPIILLPGLAYLLSSTTPLGWRKALPLAVIPVAVMLAMLTPRLLATQAAYGIPAVSTQTGMHALSLVYPCLRNDMTCDREPTDRRIRQMQQAERANLSDEERLNQVVTAKIDQRIAIQLLLEMPMDKLLLGITDGALRSILQTMLYEVGYQLRQHPQYLSAIGGRTLTERLSGFQQVMLTDRFMLIWAIGQALVLLGLPIQLLGLAACLGHPDRRAMAVFLVVTAVYFLAINLSYGNPKYGLPLSPAMIVVTVAGLISVMDWLIKRRPTPTTP